MELRQLVSSRFQQISGELLMGGVPITKIAAHYGTPVFVYDGEILRRQYRKLRNALPGRFSISYSVKANPNPAFISFFLSQGCGVEIASAGEFYVARKTGCAADRIIFAGPGKRDEELEMVIRAGIGELHAESALELERISDICHRGGYRARIALRVNPTEEGQGGAMRMGGKPIQFGIDEESLHSVLDRVLQDDVLEFRGIHLFAGTQILDAHTLIAQYRKGMQIARRAAQYSGKPLHTVDFGGGLGIPYFSSDGDLDLAEVEAGIQRLMNELLEDASFRGTQFVIEPGRFLVGECGVYVCRVLDIKISRGKKFLIVDGGMHHHLAASGNLGQVIKKNFPVAILNKLDRGLEQSVDIVGPLCTPLDMLARGVEIPDPEVGDLVGVFQSGAYARSASPLGFLSNLTPPEVWAHEGSHHEIRRRGTYEDMWRDITHGEFTAAA